MLRGTKLKAEFSGEGGKTQDIFKWQFCKGATDFS